MSDSIEIKVPLNVTSVTRTYRTQIADALARAWGDRLERAAAEVEHIGTGWALFTENRVRAVMHAARRAEGFANYFGAQAIADFGALLMRRQICQTCEGLGCPDDPACDNGSIVVAAR